MQKWIKKPTVSADLSHSARLDANRLNRWGEKFKIWWCRDKKSPKECGKSFSNQSHCLPKFKKAHLRSLNGGYMQKRIKRAIEMNCSTKVVQYQRY